MGKTEIRRLIGDHPEGGVAERQAPEAEQPQDNELGPRHRGLDLAVHEAQADDGGDADNEQGKIAHFVSNLL